MRTALVILGLLVVVSLSSAQSQGGSHLPNHTKGNLWYSVRGERSQILLLFKGPVQHKETLAGNTLTVNCANIASSPSRRGTNLHFSGGLVRHATVGQIEDGRTEIVLTFKTESVQYTIAHDEALGVLKIDVFPNPFVIMPRTLSQSVAPRKIIQRRSAEPDIQRSEPPIVDLRALVRSQLEDPNAAARAASSGPVEVKSASQKMSDFQRNIGGGALPWLAAVCVSLLITLGSIILLLYGVWRQNKSSRGSESEVVISRPRQFPVYARRLADQHFTENRRIRDLGGEDHDVPENLGVTVDAKASPDLLAEQYQRSRGDVELAMKLREQTLSQEAGRKVGIVTAADRPKKGTLRAAKKLGVGTGELELASKLGVMQNAFSEKEGAS